MSAAANRAWDMAPRWVKDGVGLAQARRHGEFAPPFPAVPGREFRVMIGPANFSSQGSLWAAALNRDPRIAAVNMITGTANPFGFPADYIVPNRVSAHSRAWQRRFLDELAANFTHVLIEAELRILGGAFGGDVRAQVRALAARGLSVAMVAHGTDVRLPSRHVRAEPDSPYAADWPDVDLVEAGVLHNQAILRDLALPTFVSTPGLLADVPGATVLPLCVDAAMWAQAASRPVLESGTLRVVHVPSAGKVKGTHRIAAPTLALAEAGEIEYVQVSGISHEEMPAAYGNADVVLDQFLIGDYGVAACEAMAAGRVVVGHVADEVRAQVRDAHGIDLPIVEATVATVPDVLREIAANRRRYRAIAAAGPRFVEKVHTGDASRAALLPWLTA